MAHIADDFSPEAMTRGIVDNLYAVFVGLLPRLPEGERFPIEGAMGYFTGIPFPMVNGVVRPRFPAESADAGIDAFIEHARRRKVPMLWHVTPGSEPEDLGKRLEARGFQPGGQVPGMAIDLSTVTAEELPPGLTISAVRDEADARHVARLLCQCFGMPSWLQESWERIVLIEGVNDDATFQSYLGWVDGEPVAVSGVAYMAGVAGLYNIGTLAEFRGRGIGRAITLAPIVDARARGYRIGILHASDMGFPVYRNLGFETYCEIQLYAWTDST
jgi:ribosomal protein S18 acetylase RimI-like enzyme